MMITNHQSEFMKLKKAFTLVEIMIVVAVIALLAAIAIPNLQRANNAAQYAKNKQFVTKMVAVFEAYSAATGVYPQDVTSLTSPIPPYASPTCRPGWWSRVRTSDRNTATRTRR